jgi:molybdenum cofactor cytidylyltransferase
LSDKYISKFFYPEKTREKMMKTIQKIVPVILAAGRSSRMGAPKPFIRVKGKTFLENIAEGIRNSGVSFRGSIIYNPEHLSRLKALRLPDFDLIPNDHVEWGPLYSVQLALSGIPSHATAFLLCLVDHPFICDSTYSIMLRNHKRFPEQVLIPVYKGKRGHPTLFPARFFPEILQLPKNFQGGLQSFIKDRPDSVLEVPVLDPGIMMDIDTPGDLAKYLKEKRS